MKKIILIALMTGSLFASDIEKENKTIQDINLDKCIGCHGANFEKAALGKSRIVKDLEPATIANSLMEYKSGIRTTPMGMLMSAQVRHFSLYEILLISEHIGKQKEKF